MRRKPVRILESPLVENDRLLPQLHDSVTGKYRFPIPEESLNAAYVNNALDNLKKAIERLDRGEGTGEELIKAGIIDTGLMSDHPFIKPFLANECVNYSDDLTQEDLNGHGTTVALVLIVTMAASLGDALLRLKLVNIKVMDADGRGSEDALVKGLDWATENRLPLVNVSVGIYKKRWGLFACRGTCKVCRAAERTAQFSAVCAAAGNEPGKTYCPATVGVKKPESKVLSVAASDYPNSGIGNISSTSRILLIDIQ